MKNLKHSFCGIHISSIFYYVFPDKGAAGVVARSNADYARAMKKSFGIKKLTLASEKFKKYWKERKKDHIAYLKKNKLYF
jgi:hypothetical protein